MGWWKLTLVAVLVVAVTLQFAQGQTSIQFSFGTNLPTGDEAVALSLGGTQQIFLPIMVNIEPSTALLQSNIVVGITVTSGTATSGTDFVLARDEVTFDAGANDGNTISIRIEIWDDLIVEGTEGFTLTGSVVTTGTIGVFVGGPATVSILDDDTEVTEITTLADPPSVSPTRGVQPTSSLTSVLPHSMIVSPTRTEQPLSSQAIRPSVSPTRVVQLTFSVTMGVSPSMSPSVSSTATVLQPPSSPVQAIPPSVSPTEAMQPSSSLTSPTGTVLLPSFPEQTIPQLVSPTEAVLPSSPMTMLPTETVQPSSSPTQVIPPSVPLTKTLQTSSSETLPTRSVQLSSSPMQAIPPSVSPTQVVLVSFSPTQEIPAVEPSSSLTTAIPPSVLPTGTVQPPFSPVLVITSSPQPTQQPLQPISIFTMETVQQSLTPTSPTETSLSTEPLQTTGQLSGGEIAAIVIVLVIVTKAIFLTVCAIGVFYIQRKRQRYILKSSYSQDHRMYVTDTNIFGRPPKATDEENLVESIQMEAKAETVPISYILKSAPTHQDHGTSVTDTSTFVRPPKATDEEHLVAIQMEAKAETVPVFSLVAINPAALEDDDEQVAFWMNNSGGEGVEQESKTDREEVQ